MAVEEVVIKYKAEVDQMQADLKRVMQQLGMVEDKATSSAKKTGDAFKGAADKVGSSMSNLMGKVGELGAAVGIAFSVEAIIEFGKASLKAFAESEKAAQSLLFALNGNVVAQKSLIHQAEQLQKTTVFEDDAIVAQQAYLAAQGRTEEQIKKTISAATQLSTVTGEDLASSVQKLDATYEGNIGRLGKLDNSFKKLSFTQLQNGEAIDLVNKKYAGFAENATETTAGQLEQLNNKWGDFKENIGSAIASGLNFLIDFTSYVAHGFRPSVVDDLGKVGETADQTAKRIEGIDKALATFAKHQAGDFSDLTDKQLQDMLQSNLAVLSKFQDSTDPIRQKQNEQLQAEITRRKNATKEKEKEIVTLDLLNQKLQDQNNKLAKLEVGSKDFIETQKDIKALEEQIAHAKGEQTQAEKDAEQKRQAAAEKKKHNDEEELKRIDAIKKANVEASVEAYKASQDARNQELVDLDTKARKMQEDGVKQATIDEFTRVQEKNINDKYDKIDADESQKRQDKMLADLEDLVDKDAAAEEKKTAKHKEEMDKRLEVFNKYTDAASAGIKSLFDLGSALNERESQELDAKQKAELDALDEKFGIKKEKETEYEREKRQIQEKFAKEQNDIKLKQAKFDKAQAIFNIAIDTAKAIAKSVAESPLTFGLPWSAVAAAIGVAQEAAVIAKPLPQFAKGGKVKGGRQIIQVNEQGEEFVATAKAVKQYGPYLEAMNKGKFEDMLLNTRMPQLVSRASAAREQLNSRERQQLKQAIKAELDDTGIRHDIQRNKTVKLDDETISKLSRGFAYRNKKRTP